jgi:hypothetical protein
VDELGRRDVAGDGVAVHFADDYFFVRRGHRFGLRTSDIGPQASAAELTLRPLAS